MAGIFQIGAFFMGFDMDPTAAQIFTQAASGSGNSGTTPYSFGYSWSLGNNTPGILLGVNLTTLIVGFWVAPNAALPASDFVCTFYDATAGAIQVALRVSSTG